MASTKNRIARVANGLSADRTRHRRRERAMGGSNVPQANLLLLYSRPEGRFAYEDLQVNALATRFEGRADFTRTDPRRASVALQAWISPSQPTLLLVKQGSVVGGAIGRFPLDELNALVERSLR